MSDPKPQTIGEHYASWWIAEGYIYSDSITGTTATCAAWDAAWQVCEAALRAQFEQEKATAVAGAYEVAAQSLLNGKLRGVPDTFAERSWNECCNLRAGIIRQLTPADAQRALTDVVDQACAKIEQEKAAAVAAAEEATILELLGDAHTLCRVSNWTEDGDCDIGDVVASEAKVDRKTGALARTTQAAVDQARAEATKALRERLEQLEKRIRPIEGDPTRVNVTVDSVYAWCADQLKALLEETK